VGRRLAMGRSGLAVTSAVVDGGPEVRSRDSTPSWTTGVRGESSLVMLPVNTPTSWKVLELHPERAVGPAARSSAERGFGRGRRGHAGGPNAPERCRDSLGSGCFFLETRPAFSRTTPERAGPEPG
jgi:hypothetical protein